MKISDFYERSYRLSNMVLQLEQQYGTTLSPSITKLARDLSNEVERLKRRREKQWQLPKYMQM